MNDIMEMMKISMQQKLMEAEERAAIAKEDCLRFERSQQQQQAMAHQQHQMMMMMVAGMQQQQGSMTSQTFTGLNTATGNIVNMASPPRTVGSKSEITDLTASATTKSKEETPPKTPTPITRNDFDSEFNQKDE